MSEENKNKRKDSNIENSDIEKIKEELKDEIKKEMYEEMKNNSKDNKSFEEKAKETVNKIMDTEDNTKDYEKRDIESNKMMAILAYFGPLCFIPYFTSKESKFAMYHARQGINLFIIEAVVAIISYFLVSIFEISKMCNVGGLDYVCGVYTPIWVTIPVDFVQCVLGIITLIGLIYACQGKAKEVPILGKIKIVK